MAYFFGPPCIHSNVFHTQTNNYRPGIYTGAHVFIKACGHSLWLLRHLLNEYVMLCGKYTQWPTRVGRRCFHAAITDVSSCSGCLTAETIVSTSRMKVLAFAFFRHHRICVLRKYSVERYYIIWTKCALSVQNSTPDRLGKTNVSVVLEKFQWI